MGTVTFFINDKAIYVLGVFMLKQKTLNIMIYNEEYL